MPPAVIPAWRERGLAVRTLHNDGTVRNHALFKMSCRKDAKNSVSNSSLRLLCAVAPAFILFHMPGGIATRVLCSTPAADMAHMYMPPAVAFHKRTGIFINHLTVHVGRM